MSHTWTIETRGSEHNARAEQVATDEHRSTRNRLEARIAGRCPECGGSGEVFFTDTMKWEPCPEGCPLRQ